MKKNLNCILIALMVLFIITGSVFAGLNDGLVAYYPFNGNANDESGNGNHGDTTGHAPTLATDRFGNENSAYSFDGIDDYIQVPNSPTIDSIDQITVSLWIKPESEAPYYFPYAIIEKYGSWDLGQRQRDLHWGFKYSPDSFIDHWTFDLELDKYYHFVMTYNENEMRIYINNTLDTTITQTGTISPSDNDLYIGENTFGGDYYYDGVIDDIRIYNRALTKSEIDSLYHEGGWALYETGTVTDIDDNTYQTVKIGNQWWMAENLKVTHYRNGEAITRINNNTVWSAMTEGAYCFYDNDDNNGDTYGVLYNWYAVNDNRNIAPEGWHVPTDEEWKELEMYLGMSESDANATGWRGTDEGSKLKEIGTTHWNSPNTGATNESGFSALPGGSRGWDGPYNFIGFQAYLWSSSDLNTTEAVGRTLDYDSSGIYVSPDGYGKEDGFSVRCIKDSEPPNLVAYYPFNGNANDESGNGNDGTVSGATLTADRFGNGNSAYEFDGIDDYIISEIGNIGTMGLSFWYKSSFPDPDIEWPHFFWYNNSYCCMYSFSKPGQEGYIYSRKQLADNNGYHVVTDYPPLFDTWHHVFLQYDSINNYLKLYIDGNNMFNGIYTNDGGYHPVSQNDTIYWGYWGAPLNLLSFKGSLDDIKIFNCILDSATIDSLYHVGGWGENILIAVDSLNAFIGDTIDIPVNVEFPNGKNYDSAELTFSGYQDGLDFIEVDTSLSMTGGAGWSNAVNETGDSLIISWFAGAEDISGSGVFCRLKFAVTGEPCNFVPINIESALFNTGDDSVSITNGGIYIKPIPVYGDVDSNGEVQAHDAALILKYVIEVETLDCQGLVNADVTLNDTVTALDASIILQYGVGLIDTLPYDTSNGNLLAKGSITMKDGSYVPGQVIEVPLTLSGGSNILSFEGCMSYRPEQLVYKDIEWSQVTEGFLIEVNESDGRLVFAGAGSAPDGESGVFATVRFVINASFSGVETTVSLDELRWNEGAVKNDVAVSTLSRIAAIDLDVSGIPTEYSLSRNYPNPFNPVTTIQYAIPEKSYVTLTIYNIAGQALEVLENQSKEPGYYSVQWDASKVGSGVYLYKIDAGRFSDVKKCVILK